MPFQSKSIFQSASKSDIIRIMIFSGMLYCFLQIMRLLLLIGEADNGFFENYFLNPLSLPNHFSIFIKQPWSIFTFLFIETDFWLLLPNMIWLWIFGTVIEDLLGFNKVFPIFFLGGIFSGIVLLVFQYFFPSSTTFFSSTLGGVSAVAIAAIVFKPRYGLYFFLNKPIPLYVFAIIFFIINLVLKFQQIEQLIVLIAGAIFGFLSQHILASFVNWFATKTNFALTYLLKNENFMTKTAEAKHKMLQQRTAKDEEKLNHILDKINETGMDSLSTIEKEFLQSLKS